MSITPEMLAAYADGELGPEDRAAIEAAIDADPALAERVAAHRALRETLSTHFAPILDSPVPERLTALLEKPQVKEADVVDLAAARVAKAEQQREHSARFTMPSWAAGGAIAASLAIGLVIGGRLPSDAPVRSIGGQLIAGGALDKALTTQLASEQGGGQNHVRILLSFKANDGHYCRGFAAGATSGIACRKDGNWALVRTQTSSVVGGGEYQQASSANAAIMAAAQDMAAGGAFDPQAERAARDAGWRD